MGFHHVENSLYLGGGHLDGQYFSRFSKILPDGEITELKKMSTPKCYFSMALWKEKNALFTLGGWNKSDLNAVNSYSLPKNTLKLHSLLPKGINNSSAVVLYTVLYNLGGYRSPHSLMWCRLAYNE